MKKSNTTHNLYYDIHADDCWTVAPSGAKGIGVIALNHIEDNDWDIDKSTTDEDIETLARDIVRGNPFTVQDCEWHDVELSEEQSAIGLVCAMKWLREIHKDYDL